MLVLTSLPAALYALSVELMYTFPALSFKEHSPTVVESTGNRGKFNLQIWPCFLQAAEYVCF